MEAIRQKVLKLADKNANPSFLGDVQSKAEELFGEFNESARQYSEELDKLKQINFLNEKVQFFVEIIISVFFCMHSAFLHIVIYRLLLKWVLSSLGFKS